MARAPMDSMRKTALVAGVLYLITFLAIGTFVGYGSVLTDPAYITSAGSDAALRLGALIEVIVALAGVGTAIVLFPVVKRQSETFALGFVTTRVLEGATIFVGVISLLALATLHQAVGLAAGADAGGVLTTGAALLATYKATFLLGQTLMPGMNAIMLGYLMFRSGLVPRVIPALGLIGGPLMISSALGQVLGINEQVSGWSLIALLPIFAWELSLGLYLAIKGFKPSAPIMVAAAAESRRTNGSDSTMTTGAIVAPSGAA
jgi:uncharacterized protein DUF4386